MATAWSSDGLIEGIEDCRPDRFALGVQWHPELGWKEDRLSQALFDRFIAASREYRREVGSEIETASIMEEEATNVIWARKNSAGESR